MELLAEQRFPDSLGLLFTALTVHCGFAANDGEYKMMGLAPYGSPRFVDALLSGPVRLGRDGALRLDQQWFRYRAGRRMGSQRLDRLLEGPPAPLGATPGEREADIAASAQEIVTRAVLASACHLYDETGEQALCLAGGVALNGVANGRLLREGPFSHVWVQPAAGDAGGAIGAALWVWHESLGKPRRYGEPARHNGLARDSMSGAALGPSFTSQEVAAAIAAAGLTSRRYPNHEQLVEVVAQVLAEGSVVGWFEGPMEFGPRALGHRSVLVDPCQVGAVDRLNRVVKGREGFRPFAPAVMVEEASEWFELDEPSPYMSFVVPVREFDGTDSTAGASFADRLQGVLSPLPACTHVDGTARVQTVDPITKPVFHALLAAFHRRSGVPVLVNTSFNRRGEPIVCTPEDALAAAAAMGLDFLVAEGHLVDFRPESANAAGGLDRWELQ